MTTAEILAAKRVLDEAPVPDKVRFSRDPVTGKVIPTETDRMILELFEVEK